MAMGRAEMMGICWVYIFLARQNGIVRLKVVMNAESRVVCFGGGWVEFMYDACLRMVVLQIAECHEVSGTLRVQSRKLDVE